jgi:hypothetical protein
MTSREIVNRKLRKWIAWWFVGFGIFAATPVIAIAFNLLLDNDLRFVFFMLPGLAMIMGLFFYIMFAGVKCPHCECNLAPLALFWPNWRGLPSLPAIYKFCPCCARSFDQPVERPV